MARRVFFSFHYQDDIFRVNRIRHCQVTKDWESNSFVDAASWESIRRKGDEAVKGWIDRQLEGTGVTVVLIGTNTHKRHFVRYEIEESHKRGNGLLGIYINKMKDMQGKTARKGGNPLDDIVIEVPTAWNFFTGGMEKKRLSEIFPTFDWVTDDGYHNIGHWIEDAAGRAGR